MDHGHYDMYVIIAIYCFCFCLVCLDDLLYGINAFSAYLLRFIPGALILTLFFSILRVADWFVLLNNGFNWF